MKHKRNLAHPPIRKKVCVRFFIGFSRYEKKHFLVKKRLCKFISNTPSFAMILIPANLSFAKEYNCVEKCLKKTVQKQKGNNTFVVITDIHA
jgi:hypothetical protein